MWATKHAIVKYLLKIHCQAYSTFTEENSFTSLSTKSKIPKLLHVKSTFDFKNQFISFF